MHAQVEKSMKSKVFESRLEILSMYVVMAMWCVGIFIAIFAPIDILEKAPLLKTYVNQILRLISSEGKLGSQSNFPQVTQLYYALLVWTIPFFFIISHSWMMTRVAKDRDGLLFKERLSMANKVWLILLLPIWVAFIYFASLNHGGDTRLVSFGASRWALGLFGIAFPLGVAAMMAVIAFSVRRVFFGDKYE